MYWSCVLLTPSVKVEPMQREAIFTQNQACDVSDIIYQRVRSAGFGKPDLPAISTVVDRSKFINILKKHGLALCENIGVPYAETAGVHDVAFGKSPHGDFYFCDLLANLYEFKTGCRVLDFGCSSGRVIRNLKSAFPDIVAFGCDPRPESIEFIKKIVPDVSWVVSEQSPPLPDTLHSFDMVFAISVWSHFSETRALEWFAEMYRVTKPGGTLIFSTHGYRSVFHISHVLKKMNGARESERLTRLAGGELHFTRYPNTDLDSHWGMAYIPIQWVADHLSDCWIIDGFFPGMAMKNQDVFVLTRR